MRIYVHHDLGLLVHNCGLSSKLPRKGVFAGRLAVVAYTSPEKQPRLVFSHAKTFYLIFEIPLEPIHAYVSYTLIPPMVQGPDTDRAIRLVLLPPFRNCEFGLSSDEKDPTEYEMFSFWKREISDSGLREVWYINLHRVSASCSPPTRHVSSLFS